MALEGYKGTILDQIWSTAEERRPAYKVVIWNPRRTTVQDVVLGQWNGPSLDISDWVSSVSVDQNQVFENNENAVSSSINMVVEVEQNVAIGENRRINIDHRLFRDGTPIRVYEGDRRVLRDDWIPVFTGVIRGFPGAQVAARGRKQIRVVGYGRGQAFANQIIVGQSWPYGTDLGDMAVDVAMNEMGLQREEIRFGTFGFEARHKANQLTQINKMLGLFEIMNTVSRKPYFDAFGRLVSHDTGFDKPPVYVYDRSTLVRSVTRVQQTKSTVNSVQVIGLNSTLTKVVNPEKPLTEINVTTGYFDAAYRERIWYSEDRTRRAENTRIVKVTKPSIGGGDASWVEIDEFSGRLTIDTGYAPWVIGSIAFVWTVASLLEYAFDAYLEGLQVGVDISGYAVAAIRFAIQLSKAASMAALLYAMTVIGRWRIEVYGEPFEYVHEENRAIAALKGVPVADLNELEIVLPWLYNSDLTKARARTALRREVVKGHQYQIDVLSNALIEVDDLIVIRDPSQLPNSNFWTFYITSISRRLQRDGDEATMRLTAWHCKESATA